MLLQVRHRMDFSLSRLEFEAACGNFWLLGVTCPSKMNPRTYFASESTPTSRLPGLCSRKGLLGGRLFFHQARKSMMPTLCWEKPVIHTQSWPQPSLALWPHRLCGSGDRGCAAAAVEREGSEAFLEHTLHPHGPYSQA